MKFAPSAMTWKSLGKKPVANPSVEPDADQLKRPLTNPCATPATMKRPTPEPIPHLETTSSMNMTRTPPRQICRKISSITTAPLPPKMAATAGSAVIHPPNTFGRASMKIITKISSFCRPI